MNKWIRAERLTLLGILVAVVGSLAALAVIPELREFFGLNERPHRDENVLEETPYEEQVTGQESPKRVDPQIEVQGANEMAVSQPQPSQTVGGIDRTSDHQGTSAPSRDSQLASPNELKGESAADAPIDSPAVPAETEPEQSAIETYRGTYFSFDLLGCQRAGDRFQCSLTVTNLTGKSRGINLCGESEIVDDMGRELRTSVRFSGGNSCGLFRFAPDLPRALEMSAQAYADSRTLNIVFGNTVAFRDVQISEAR